MPNTDALVEKHLARCLSQAVRGCASNPTLIFSGCAEVAQLAALVLDRLGYTYHVLLGKAYTFEGQWVGHFWIEIPDKFRIETNPSQILGIPAFAAVLPIDVQAKRYKPSGNYPELLERFTPAGHQFFSKLADQVSACIKRRRTK
jgi:hypothetical protein